MMGSLGVSTTEDGTAIRKATAGQAPTPARPQRRPGPGRGPWGLLHDFGHRAEAVGSDVDGTTLQARGASCVDPSYV